MFASLILISSYPLLNSTLNFLVQWMNRLDPTPSFHDRVSIFLSHSTYVSFLATAVDGHMGTRPKIGQ